MNIVIMGSGRVGARLARLFDHEGHDVTIIDTHQDAFQRLDLDFKGRTMVGTGIDVDVLKRAGIEQADVFLAVTNLDNPNIMASQIAKVMFNVPRVVARIYDPAREDTYHDLGLETICPTTIVSQRIHQAVINNTPGVLDDDEVEQIAGAVQPAPSATNTQPAPVSAPQAPSASAASRPNSATGAQPQAAAPLNGGKGPAQALSQSGNQPQATGVRRFFR